MTYQPYPTTGGSTSGSNMVPQAPQPQTVRVAMILMYVGAAVSAVGLVITLVLSSRIKAAVGRAARNVQTRSHKPLTVAQLHSIENAYIVIVVVVLLIAIGLWLWMAWANGRGKSWARIVSSVFFGLNTLWLVFGGSRAAATAIFIGIGWLAGLGALIFLWRRETSQYIAQSQ